MDAKTKIDKASMSLMLRHQFFSALCLRMRLVEVEPNHPLWGGQAGTMATDGEHIYWSRAFVDKTSLEELEGVLAHEGLHYGLGHMFRRDDRDPRLFNIACDLSINHILTDAGLKLPGDAVTLASIQRHLNGKLKPAVIQSLPNLNAEKIYSYLEQVAEKIPQAGWGGLIDPEDLTPDNKSEKQAQADEALQAAAQTAEMTQGKIPSALEQLIKKMREPKVDWRNMVWRFVVGERPYDYTYRRPNKHYADDGLYLPTIDKIGIGSLAIFIDTSGSVSDQALEQFLGEINAISTSVQPEKTWVIMCDAQVHENHVREYEAGEEIVKLEVAGRGGTSFKPPFEYIRKHDIKPDKIIYLTDLMGDFPADPEIPTLWVSVHPGQAPFGDTVVINV